MHFATAIAISGKLTRPGRAYGLWENTDFREINGIRSDHDGGLFIAEGGAGLRRGAAARRPCVTATWEGMLEAPLSEPFTFSVMNHRPDNPVSVDQVVWSLHRSTGSLEVFVDSRLCQSQTSERSRATHPLTELLIGGAYGGCPFRSFVGAMADCRIYSCLLSATEAAALMP